MDYITLVTVPDSHRVKLLVSGSQSPNDLPVYRIGALPDDQRIALKAWILAPLSTKDHQLNDDSYFVPKIILIDSLPLRCVKWTKDCGKKLGKPKPRMRGED
jgi:hypothetical protein